MTNTAAAPVNGFYYNVLDPPSYTVSDADAYYFAVRHQTGVNADCGARIVFDGVTITSAAVNMITNTYYYFYIDGINNDLNSSVNRTPVAGDLSMPAHNVRFQFAALQVGVVNVRGAVRLVSL